MDPILVGGDAGEDVGVAGFRAAGAEGGDSGQVPAAVLHVAVERTAAVSLEGI